MTKNLKAILSLFVLTTLSGCGTINTSSSSSNNPNSTPSVSTNAGSSSSSTSSSATSSSSSETSSSSSSSSETSSSSSSSSVASNAIDADELNDIASSLYELNSSEDFVGPNAMWVKTIDDMSLLYENVPGEEDFIYTLYMDQAYNLETGYMYQAMSDEYGTFAQYSYASGTKYILAINEYENKYYYEVDCGDEATATLFAISMIQEMEFAEGLYDFSKGLAALQSVTGFISQYQANNDDDPDNDITMDYDSYDLTINATSDADLSFDSEIILDAKAVIDLGDGMVQNSSMEGTLVANFSNGYLTRSLDEATMIEEIDMYGEVMKMTIYSKQETVIDYTFDEITPDLSEYTLSEL